MNEYAVYVLMLEENKFYVGQTTKAGLDSRLANHYENKGAEWTKKYKPIKKSKPLIYYLPTKNEAGQVELTKTLEYMHNYGINNVRGHQFAKIHLDPEDIKIITNNFIHDDDRCFNCGEVGHYSRDCSR